MRVLALSACLSALWLAGCTTTPAPVVTDTCVPRYETVMEPIYERQSRPKVNQYEVPVYSTRHETVYRETRTPIWGEVDAPVYRTRRTPVTISVYDPCTCDEREVELWNKEEQVEVGVKRVRKLLGHKIEKVACGTRAVRVQTGWRTVTEPDGCETECVKVGERPVRKQVGWQPGGQPTVADPCSPCAPK